MQTWIPLTRNLCRLVAISALFVMALAISSSLVPSAASADPVDESSRYEQYASDRTPTGYSVGWGSLYYDESFDGTPLSLLVDGQERTFDHGFWAHADSSIYYNDIQEYGYERFDAWVGLSHTARANGKAPLSYLKWSRTDKRSGRAM